MTHINVRPTRYWLERFAEVGFAPVVGFDATFLCPHAMLLERSDEGRDERSLAAFTEIVRQRLKVAEARQTEAKTCDALRQEIAVAKKAEVVARSEAKQAEDRALAATQAAKRGALAAKQAEEAAWAARQDEEKARSELEKRVAALSLGESEARAAAQQAVQHSTQVACLQRAAEERARVAESHLRFMAQSKAWRVARTLQRTSSRLPLLRRAVKLVWWNCSLQLPRQIRLRRENNQTMQMIRQSGLFDDAYYRENTPDLAVSGMDGALHFNLYGWKEGRKPSPGFDPAFYLGQNPDVAAAGINPLLHYVQHGRAQGRQPLPSGGTTELQPALEAPSAAPVTQRPPSVRSMIRAHCASWAPLPVFADPRATPTLTILTDSVDANHLFGGVGTALVIAALAARRTDARLRLVTRHEPPDPAALGEILQAHRVDWKGATDIVHMPVGDDRPLPLGEKDIVLTTSWWSTRAVLGSVNASRILYLLQEDERMFYPYGDSRLRCAETLAEPDRLPAIRGDGATRVG